MEPAAKLPPMADVTAEYHIENPTNNDVQEDFGFPILRGIHVVAMAGRVDIRVRVDNREEETRPTVISNSVIYGIIRRNAREAIERGISGDPQLARLAAAVRAAPAKAHARESLAKYLNSHLGWNNRDAALLVEYAGVDLGSREYPWLHDRWDIFASRQEDIRSLTDSNLGSLVAIGEQKATQLFACLASRFEKDVGSAYEEIFTAWGGDVRERSIDLETGRIRRRELDLPAPKPIDPKLRKLPPEVYDRRLTADPTVYARVDYLDPQAKISPEEKASCQAILKNLPVTFTFTPMNLLHYRVKFPAHSKRTVSVSYRQYAFADTHGSGSYQLAYVLHPAMMWRQFGPIRVTLKVPQDISSKASTEFKKCGEEKASTYILIGYKDPDEPMITTMTYRQDLYQATLSDPERKRGELFVGIDKSAWDKMFPPKKPEIMPKGEPLYK